METGLGCWNRIGKKNGFCIFIVKESRRSGLRVKLSLNLQRTRFNRQ